ncbi:hypothetical protein V8D89_006960 [Ganoderma adspersum]
MSLSDAQRITLVHNAYTSNLLTVGMGVLVGYDYVLTIRREARLFWKRKVTAASFLFFANRYLALLYYVGLAYYRCLDLPFPTQDYTDISLRYLEYFPWAGTIFIRSGQSIADIVVIGVTWKATYHARREGSMSRLLTIMFTNGSVLLVLNILHILFIFLPHSFLHIPLTNTSYVTKFSEPLTAILISRFILDLHETNRAMARQVYLTTIELMSADIDIMHHPSSEAAVSGGEEEELEEWSVSTNPPISASTWTWNHHKGSELGSTMDSSSRLNPA